MFHLFVTTDDAIVKVAPAYNDENRAYDDVKKILGGDKVLYGKYETGGQGAEPNTWRAWTLHRIRWFHVVSNGVYSDFIEGKLVG